MVITNTPVKIDKVVGLQIGQVGENATSQIKFDVSAWLEKYPDISISVRFKRPGEESVLACSSSLEDDVLTWTVSSWETQIAGVGYAEVRAIDGEGRLAKSKVIPCSIEVCIDGTDESYIPVAVKAYFDDEFERIDTEISSEVDQQISAETAARTNSDLELSEEIAVERERITNLATLDEGSTTGDAELIDIRVGADGVTYESAGTAVRSQITDLKSAFDENLMDYVQTINPTNWFKSSGMKSGILKVDGSVVEDSTKAYSDYFIPVVPGNTVRLTRGDNFNSLYIYKVTAYDADKNVLSAKGMNSSGYTYTVPADVAYIKFTMTASNIPYYPMLTVSGDKPTSYSAYFDPYTVFTKNFLMADADAVMQCLTSGTFSTKNLANAYGCALPKTKFFQTVGLPQSWYYKNMVTPPTNHIACAIGGSYYTKIAKGISFPNETELSSANGYLWSYYDVLLNRVDYTTGSSGYGWQRRIVAENLPNCTVLVIGDSTVDHDVMTATMLSHFTEKGATLTLLGTLGSDGNYNEGRAGWSAADYYTDRQYNGVVNPFYNPNTETFDFSYYMTQQGYSDLDYVVIQLGINDLYNADNSAIEPLWENISGLIDSIKTYNSSVKVILNLPTTPNSDDTQHSVAEFLYRNRVIRYNELALKNSLSKYGTSSVRCSYCHLILDPDTEIRDNVHPTNAGYAKMALEVVNQINCWNAGV